MRMPPWGAERIDAASVHAAGVAILLYFFQQHVDEVQAWLDGHHYARFQRAGHVQAGVALWTTDLAAAIRFRKARHVVHLQADGMALTAREEGSADARGQWFLRRYRENAEVLQDTDQSEVRAYTQLAVVHPGARAGPCRSARRPARRSRPGTRWRYRTRSCG